MTRVKICGITNLDDAMRAVRYGADELGFNFYSKSPRFVDAETARGIISDLPPGVIRIGVFVNERIDTILETAAIAELDGIQLHGDESPGFVAALKQDSSLKVIKAFRISPEFVPDDVATYDVDAVLLDAYTKNAYGGTGESFNWNVAAELKRMVAQIYLAGGLSEQNVGRAIAEVQPYCVDACSRLESEPGIKDELKLKEFLRNAGKNEL